MIMFLGIYESLKRRSIRNKEDLNEMEINLGLELEDGQVFLTHTHDRRARWRTLLSRNIAFIHNAS